MREMQKNEENMEEKKNTKKLQWFPLLDNICKYLQY